MKLIGILMIILIIFSLGLNAADNEMTVKIEILGLNLIEIKPDKILMQNGFYISEAEITNKQYIAYLKDKNIKAKDNLTENRKPVVNVTMADCRDFCAWLGTKYEGSKGEFRLPSKKEWLYAAYGGKRKYPWGDEELVNTYNYGIDNNDGHHKGRMNMVGVKRVKLYLKGATPDGIYDMWGNVNEFVLYESNKPDFWEVPYWMGGSFETGKNKPSQSYWGFAHDPKYNDSDIGFRIVFIPSE